MREACGCGLVHSADESRFSLPSWPQVLGADSRVPMVALVPLKTPTPSNTPAEAGEEVEDSAAEAASDQVIVPPSAQDSIMCDN